MTSSPGPGPQGGEPVPRGLGDPPAEATGRGPSIRRWLIPALVLIPIVGAAATYLLFFTGDSPERLTLSTPADRGQTGSPATATPGAGRLVGQWTVGAGSVAGYRVREKLADFAAQSDGVGRTEAVTGGLTVRQDGNRLVAESVRMDVDVSQLKSDEAMRDRRMTSMGLETTKYPTASFASAGPVTVPATVAGGGRTTVEATGDLTIHGVTRRVTIPLQVQMNGERAEVVGSLTFPMSDFGITPPNVANFVTVESEATLEFQLFLTRG